MFKNSRKYTLVLLVLFAPLVIFYVRQVEGLLNYALLQITSEDEANKENHEPTEEAQIEEAVSSVPEGCDPNLLSFPIGDVIASGERLTEYNGRFHIYRLPKEDSLNSGHKLRSFIDQVAYIELGADILAVRNQYLTLREKFDHEQVVKLIKVFYAFKNSFGAHNADWFLAEILMKTRSRSLGAILIDIEKNLGWSEDSISRIDHNSSLRVLADLNNRKLLNIENQFRALDTQDLACKEYWLSQMSE